MSDTAPTPPEAAPVPTRRPPPSRRAAATPPPTPPGPVAGTPIGPAKREPATQDLPPGIPPHMAGAFVPRRAGVGAALAQAAPAKPLHPSFAGPDQARRLLRQQAEALRSTAQNAATNLASLTAGLKDQLAKVKGSPEAAAMAASEGLDLDLLTKFAEQLDAALALTEPPTA